VTQTPSSVRPVAAAWLALIAAGSIAVTACSAATGGTNSPIGGARVVQVVAAENFWGSIATQIGGRHAHVVSIITSPTADPHIYEPTAADARTLAQAQVVIENGIGYDPWVARLLANSSGQAVLDVGTVVGVPVGGNPHRWYNPADVQAVIATLVADFSRVDPADRAYFKAQQARFDHVALGRYHALISAIRSKYTGTPVGASESIFAMLAPALGLKLITPYAFLKAISEGTEVTAADKLTIDHQIRGHLIKIYVYNSQNVTHDVQVQLAEAKAEHIPTATITETLVPPTSTYQAWQARQLQGIEAALARATGH
jgi:zinc/manganese transport system substrate-binding protein